MSVTQEQISEAVAAELEEHGWCRFDMHDAKGRICLTEAFCRVAVQAGSLPMDGRVTIDEWYSWLLPEYQEWWSRLERLVAPEMDDVSYTDVLGQRHPWAWNDFVAQSIEDVKLMIKRAGIPEEET